MLTNEFEKQMQKHLEDLQLNPSASVWQKVEEEIKNRKRRRIVVFFLLPLALGLLGFSVYLFVYNPHKTGLTQQQVPVNEKSLTKEKNDMPAEAKEPAAGSRPQEPNQPAVPVQKDIVQKQKSITADKNNDLQISSTDPSVSGIKHKKDVQHDNDPANAQKKHDPSPVVTNPVSGNPGIVVTIDKPLTGSDTMNAVTKNAAPETKLQKDEGVVKDAASVETGDLPKEDRKENIVSPDNKKDPVAKKDNGKRKLNWGIDFSAGITSNSDATFTFAQSDRTTYNNYSSPSASAGANPPYALNTASLIKAGPAFRIGLIGELQVSKKTRLSAGLRYAYASNRIKIGAGIDTSVQVPQLNNGSFTNVTADRVYAGTQKYNHTNKYHFIQLPVGFHTQINKGKKLPVQWDAGVSVGYLVGSDVLVYDPAYGGIYFKNKKALNKTHVNAGTGISFRIQGRNKMEWVIGPEVSFDMSKIVNSGYDEIQYLLYGGIGAKLLFHKKKSK